MGNLPKPAFPANAFAGTSSYYVQYRLPYPQRLLRHLLNRAATDGRGRLLDVACGPGRLTLELAASFKEVWAIDVEPEMIEAARQQAALRRMNAIQWILGSAEGLEAPSASFDLITVGEAFHRLDQPRVAELALRWLKPGCLLATMGGFSVFTDKEPWQQALGKIVRRWTNPNDGNRASASFATGLGEPGHIERVMRTAGFIGVGSRTFVEAHEWTAETIIGFLRSTSVCSKTALGANAEAFEAELRAALLALETGDRFSEDVVWGYTIGAKPR